MSRCRSGKTAIVARLPTGSTRRAFRIRQATPNEPSGTSAALPLHAKNALRVEPELLLLEAQAEEREILIVVSGRIAVESRLRVVFRLNARHLLLHDLIVTESRRVRNQSR